MTRLWLTAEAQVWMKAPRTEILIPPQRDQQKRILLKKAVNSDIAYWLAHNKISRQRVWQGGVSNILMSLGQPEELKQANIGFIKKILRVKRTTIQDGQTDDKINDLAERNEEPPD